MRRVVASSLRRFALGDDVFLGECARGSYHYVGLFLQRLPTSSGFRVLYNIVNAFTVHTVSLGLSTMWHVHADSILARAAALKAHGRLQWSSACGRPRDRSPVGICTQSSQRAPVTTPSLGFRATQPHRPSREPLATERPARTCSCVCVCVRVCVCVLTFYGFAGFSGFVDLQKWQWTDHGDEHFPWGSVLTQVTSRIDEPRKGPLEPRPQPLASLALIKDNGPRREPRPWHLWY